MQQLSAFLVLLSLAACAAGTAAADGTLPTPYTAAQIEAANPAESAHVYRIETKGAETMIQRMTFRQSAGQAPVVEEVLAHLDGTPKGDPTLQVASWSELRDHAAFPAELTSRRETSCTVEAGTYDCWLYEMSKPSEGGGTSLSRFWFAKNKPGPPVLLEISVEGEITYRMELIELVR